MQTHQIDYAHSLLKLKEQFTFFYATKIVSV